MLSIVYGYCKGFVKMTLASLVVIAALIVTRFASPYVADLVNTSSIPQLVQDKMKACLIEELKKQASEQEGGWTDAVHSAPDDEGILEILNSLNSNEQGKLINSISLPDSIRDSILENNNSEIYGLMGAATFAEYLSGYLTAMIVNALCYAVTFLVVYFVLLLAVYALNLVSKLPGLNTINKAGGVAVSLIFALTLIWIFFLVMTAASGTSLGQRVLQDVKDSEFLSILYNHNMLMVFILDIGKFFLR